MFLQCTAVVILGHKHKAAAKVKNNIKKYRRCCCSLCLVVISIFIMLLREKYHWKAQKIDNVINIAILIWVFGVEKIFFGTKTFAYGTNDVYWINFLQHCRVDDDLLLVLQQLSTPAVADAWVRWSVASASVCLSVCVSVGPRSKNDSSYQHQIRYTYSPWQPLLAVLRNPEDKVTRPRISNALPV